MATLGGYKVNNIPVTVLPQQVQTAFTEVTQRLMGGNFTPVLYAGEQLVNGTNHCIICTMHPTTLNPSLKLVKMVIHLPRNYVGQGATVLSVDTLL